MHDVLIVGAGPIGLGCGIEAAKRNMSYLILEKGCLVNSLFHYPTNMTFFSTSDRLEIGDVPFVSHGDKPTRRESLEYYRRVKEAWKLNVNSFEKVLSIKKNSSGFEILSEKDSYPAKKIIIATGFYDHPNKLNVTGEDLPKVKHYFDEAHPYAYLKVAVIGGGNSSVDAALETFRRGSEVTMIVREEKLKDSVKYWVRPDIDNRIKEGSIKAFFDSEITSIRENEIDVQTPGGKFTIENDFVLAMTGYHPDFDFLKSIGIEINQSPEMSPVFNPETFETNVEGIFLAGVVCGGMETGKWFIENSRYHPPKIFDKIQKDL